MDMKEESPINQIIKINKLQRGTHIPKLILDFIGIKEAAELLVKDGVIIIRQHTKARQNWEESFRVMAENGDDELIDALLLSDWDEEEWHW
jgi:antitoxin MazE